MLSFQTRLFRKTQKLRPDFIHDTPTARSEDLEHNDLAYEPDIHSGTNAPYRCVPFTAKAGVHVKHRFPGFVRKERSPLRQLPGAP